MARRADLRVMGLIGAGHTLSHFYMLALPPLFPLLKAEFDVSYAALGLLMTLFNLATGVAQVPAGVLVDRLGARAPLIAGLAVTGLSIGLIGVAPAYWVVAVLVVTAGIGNSVFHPADYVVLSAAIDKRWIGRAFSLHTFTGNVGFMAAPATMIALAALWGWRPALIAVGALAAVVIVLLLAYGRDFGHRPAPDEAGHDGAGQATAAVIGIRPLLTRTVLALFLFFAAAAMVTSGVQAFSVIALVDVHGTGLAAANAALTAFLVTSAVGVLLGGPLADHTSRHGTLAAAAMAVSATTFLIVGGVDLPVFLVVAAFGLVGLMQGSIRPARDMMIRAAAPPGATGRVFGLVSTGLNVGGAVTPAVFGLIVDLGGARWVFFILSALLLLAIATVGVVRRSSLPPVHAEEAAAE